MCVLCSDLYSHPYFSTSQAQWCLFRPDHVGAPAPSGMLLHGLSKRPKYEWVISMIRWACPSSKLLCSSLELVPLQRCAPGEKGHGGHHYAIIFVTATDRHVCHLPTHRTDSRGRKQAPSDCSSETSPQPIQSNMILFCSGTVNAFTFLPKLFLTEDHESL